MIVLDTSALLRFLLNDDKAKAQKVQNLLESGEDVFIPDVVFPELAFRLVKSEAQDRRKLFEKLARIIERLNVLTTTTARNALLIYRDTNLDMADCLIASASLKGRLASFDRRLLKTPGVRDYFRNRK